MDFPEKAFILYRGDRSAGIKPREITVDFGGIDLVSDEREWVRKKLKETFDELMQNYGEVRFDDETITEVNPDN